MTSSWIDIKTADGTFGGYLAVPPAGPNSGKGPGIVLIQEIFGVNGHIREVADQYALDGFVVLAPDLFWRAGHRTDLGYSGDDFGKGIALMQGMDFGKAVSDLTATVAALRARPEVTGKVASLGYCMGGLLSFLAAANSGVDAAVSYYGGGTDGQLAQAPNVKCPIIFHFAEKDGYIPMTAVDAVKAAFKGHKDAAVYTYADVDHGFNCWGRSMYDQHAAALARGRTLEFLARTI